MADFSDRTSDAGPEERRKEGDDWKDTSDDEN